MKNRKKKLLLILMHWEIPLYAQSISIRNGKNNDIVIPDIPDVPLNIIIAMGLLLCGGYFVDILCPSIKKNTKIFHRLLLIILLMFVIILFFLKQLRINFYDWLTLFSLFSSFFAPPLLKIQINNHEQYNKQINNPEQNNVNEGHNNTQFNNLFNIDQVNFNEKKNVNNKNQKLQKEKRGKLNKKKPRIIEDDESIKFKKSFEQYIVDCKSTKISSHVN